MSPAHPELTLDSAVVSVELEHGARGHDEVTQSEKGLRMLPGAPMIGIKLMIFAQVPNSVVIRPAAAD
jgi:hypothetical protein